ncbi:MAG: helix-turn-helix domain-containing protein [Vallitalea sp.]|jgi:DNA-binding XRE family transcriptional regulator|nr:helix-turn-helix domain-containing protein [Vallitalea sp.]
MSLKIKSKKFHALKYLRELTGSKQEEFAKIIGVTAGQYCKKENGIQPWSLSECKIISDHINNKLHTEYTVDEIFLQTMLPISNKRKAV